MVPMESMRLLIDRPLPGAENMARDEALLSACDGAAARPVLRFYAWAEPTVSLGYFQAYAEFEALLPPAGELAVVRRTTGGGAILHDLEVTYSIVVPVKHEWVRGRPNELYRRMHRAIIAAIGGGARMVECAGAACGESTRRGPFFCFSRRHALDVVLPGGNGDADGGKIAGSAQRRGRGAILQHGSIILRSRFPQQDCASWSDVVPEVGFDVAVARLESALADELSVNLKPDQWRRDELDGARCFHEMYAGVAWTRERRRLDQIERVSTV